LLGATAPLLAEKKIIQFNQRDSPMVDRSTQRF
jgi:hypothetical protein